MKLPCVVIACKSDMDDGRGIDPQRAASVLEKYQAGLVEVSIYQEIGKDKMRRCFEWMIKSIYRERSKCAAKSPLERSSRFFQRTVDLIEARITKIPPPRKF